MSQKTKNTGISRRNFIRNNTLVATGFYIMPYHFSFNEGSTIHTWTRDLNVDVLVNQLGYVDTVGKFCVAPGSIKKEFYVIDVINQKVVYEGIMEPAMKDLGEYIMGDFSSLKEPGRYYIKTDSTRSYPFKVSKNVYQPAIALIVHYFSLQRCGASTTGYLSPCHLDDGIRMDNRKHQDVTGGWHDACDLRRWVDATIYGMIGLGKAYELNTGEDRSAILDELYWGNQYFLKMQEPQGYVMNFVGGDVEAHADSNRWTDNIVEQGKRRPILVSPNAGASTVKMLVFEGTDDRIIRTDPVRMSAQYNFIASEAMMSQITKEKDPQYSQKCLHAANKCFEWCERSDKENTTENTGAALHASLEMHKTTQEKKYITFAVEQIEKLHELQAQNKDNQASGFFYTSINDNEPYKNISDGCLAFIGLCDIAMMFPMHKDISIWKKMISAYANQYLSFLSRRNAFGIIPFGLYSQKDPGGDRKVGDYWYRYFMQPELEWWVGINSNIASAGVGLMKAAKILNDERLKNMAQRQLDWILGVNPYNSSTLISVGYNHPKQFINDGEFRPATPILPGAVMNGLGGNKNDQCIIGNGEWMISEYWTPMVAYTLWLMAEISV